MCGFQEIIHISYSDVNQDDADFIEACCNMHGRLRVASQISSLRRAHMSSGNRKVERADEQVFFVRVIRDDKFRGDWDCLDGLECVSPSDARHCVERVRLLMEERLSSLVRHSDAV